MADEQTPGGRADTTTPDPTVLTTQAVLRESFMLRELIETRLNGMDKAILLLQAKVDREPQISAVVAKLEEKFLSIEQQFSERDVRTREAQQASSTAVQAALQAAKEAVAEQNRNTQETFAKSEAAFTKQIDNIVLLVQAQAKASDEKIDDIKIRLAKTEGGAAGSNQVWVWLAVFVIIAIGAAMFLFKGG